MPKRLTDAQVEQYRGQGFTFPIDVFSEDEVARFRNNLETYEAAQGRPLNGVERAKSYLLFDWVHEMVTHANVLDAVENVIGPDILVFYSSAWIKEPSGPGFVSWHQDSTYFGLEPARHVTAWMALSPSTVESGCVCILPRSHTDGQLPVRYEDPGDNLLTSGQHVVADIDQSKTVNMALAPGQMSLHHTHALHGSNPNTSSDRRIGFCISYIPASVHQIGEHRSNALLVRGEDTYGHFGPEIAPVGNADEVSRATHGEALELFRANAREKGNTTVSRLD